MKIKSFIVVFLVLFLFVIAQLCKKDKNVTNISANGDNKSHNTGQNCMSCHVSGGSGHGWFNVAGTVYDTTKTNTYPNATVKLYTGSHGTGTLQYTIQVDALGNFFTTESIDFGSGLYPEVQGNSTTKYMSSLITIGACNSCHGNSTGKIWTK